MQTYGSNKFKTAIDICRQIENWPAAWDLRLRRRGTGLTLLRFRDGLNVVCRRGTGDWSVIHELAFAGGYRHALEYLRNATGPKTVIDLGGNIGLFSLLAARQNDVTVHAYEPGPPNFRLFVMNCLANPSLSERIVLHREAVGGESRVVKWFFDEANPGGSGLYGEQPGQTSFDVNIRSFAEVVASQTTPIALLKLDIEGAEFELLDQTPPAVWKRVNAISLELHDDPAGKMSRDEFMRRLADYGFVASEEDVCSYFLHRR